MVSLWKFQHLLIVSKYHQTIKISRGHMIVAMVTRIFLVTGEFSFENKDNFCKAD